MGSLIAGIGVLAAVNAGKGETEPVPQVPLYGVLTDARKQQFEAYMTAKKSPQWFEQVASAFEQFGLPVQAKALRARAQSVASSPEQKKKWADAIRKVMRARDAKLARKAADAAEKVGLTQSAATLRSYAQGLEDAAEAVSKVAKRAKKSTEVPP